MVLLYKHEHNNTYVKQKQNTITKICNIKALTSNNIRCYRLATSTGIYSCNSNVVLSGMLKVLKSVAHLIFAIESFIHN